MVVRFEEDSQKTPTLVSPTQTPTLVSPKKGTKITRKTVSERDPFGKTVTVVEEPVDADKAKEAAEVTSAQKKAGTALESGQDYENAKAKLIQSMQLFDAMNAKTKELSFGIDLPPGGGIRGLANNYYGYVTKQNPYTPIFVGDRYATAMALMRMIMPGRAEKMIEGVKQSLPSQFSSDEEAFGQLQESLITAIGTYAAKNQDEFPELKKEGGMARFLEDKREEMGIILKDAQTEAKNRGYEFLLEKHEKSKKEKTDKNDPLGVLK